MESGTQRPWLPEALALIAATVIVTVAFAFPSLDIAAARIFFRPGALDPWPVARQLPWSVLYDAAPWITASLVIGGLIALAAGFLQRRIDWRRHAMFLVLSVVIGPGLLINVVFKDHWDRPRPREIVEFGGPLHYVTAPLPGSASGASFPCGHCSVGFLYGAGWWIWRKRRPRIAQASLAVGLIVGTSLGIGRMAAGGHFLSDVAWSAILAYGICHVLYFHVLRLHRFDWTLDARASTVAEPVGRRHHVAAGIATLAGIGVLGALFIAPHGTPVDTRIPLSSLPTAPSVMMFEARSTDVDIVVLDRPASQISVVGELHGFGLPTSRLRTSYAFNSDREPAFLYRIEQKGWFTDLNGAVTITLPAEHLKRIVVRVQRGIIRVRDETHDSVVARGLLTLDLRTGHGPVQVQSLAGRDAASGVRAAAADAAPRPPPVRTAAWCCERL